jgi:hypothetical protein
MAAWSRCPEYVIELNRPPEERFGVIEPQMIERAQRVLAAIREVMPPSALRLAAAFNARTRWRFRRELRQIAAYTGIDWRWVMIANVSYDLALAFGGCSTVALPAPDGPVVARNMDWWPEDKLAAASCVLRYVRAGRAQLAIAGWPGSVGVVTGMSARGYAVVLNAVVGQERHRKAGYPVLLLLRKVLEDAADFDEAVAMLSRRRLFTGGLFTLVGTDNRQRVRIERTPTRAAVCWGEPDAPLVTTNHYRQLRDAGEGAPGEALRPWLESSCPRYDALLDLSERMLRSGQLTSESLLHALTDAGVIQEITAQHVIMQPSRQRIELYAPRRFLEPAEEAQAPGTA